MWAVFFALMKEIIKIMENILVIKLKYLSLLRVEE